MEDHDEHGHGRDNGGTPVQSPLPSEQGHSDADPFSEWTFMPATMTSPSSPLTMEMCAFDDDEKGSALQSPTSINEMVEVRSVSSGDGVARKGFYCRCFELDG